MEAELARDRDRRADDEVPADAPPVGTPLPMANEGASPKLVSNRSRCPYCHEDVRTERADWVACEGCLARHHTTCWGERGSCASCHGQGVLRRGRSKRRRGVFALMGLGLAVLVASGGFRVARRLDADALESHYPQVTAKNARDDILLGLAFLSQTNQRERFMDRMIAAATRYDAEGKAADAKIIRKVAAVALAQGPDAALRVLDDLLAESKPEKLFAKTKDDVAHLKIEERKLAYAIFGLDPKLAEEITRQKIAQKLLDTAQGYQDAGDVDRARTAQEAADALVRNQRDLALKLLGLPKATADVPASDTARTELRVDLESSQNDIARFHTGTLDDSYRLAAAKRLTGASNVANKIGLTDVATALAHASELTGGEKLDYEGAQKALATARALLDRADDDAKRAESEKR